MKMKFFLLLVLSFFILSKTTFAESYEAKIVDYPNDIMIESGWMQYFTVTVKNSGELNLNNVSINFDGEFPNWFESEIKQKDLLESNTNTSFLVKINVPSGLESKVYPFVLNAKSKQASDSKNFNVRIFKTRAEMMLYQVQKLEIQADEIERNASKLEDLGKDITSITEVLNEIKYSLKEIKNYISINEFEEAISSMKDANILIKEAAFDLIVAPPKETPSPVNQLQPEIIAYITIPLMLIIIFYLVIQKRKKEPLMHPVDKIKGIVLEGKVNAPSNELAEAENSRNLLEEEFKENLISKESYLELKEKYEKRIMELKAETERNKKI